ncbi:MAG: DUF6521 family protein [Zoogloeaceae bacterium]|jgi:hypothetical protein|nr:DUF6521 family protein [Zoogloeaceae bacterium]
MGRLVEEVREWNTPVVGAYLLWRFTNAYRANHPTGDAPVVLLHFIAFSMLTNSDYSNEVSGKRPNLASYTRSFEEDKKSDILAFLLQRIIQQREATMRAIDIAVATGLLAWDVENAKLHPLHKFTNKKGTASMGIDVQPLGSKAETIGKWFSELDIPTIASLLGVVL